MVINKYLTQTISGVKMKNKKGMFFTLIAISLLSLFLISYSLYSVFEDDSVTKRIRTMNNFIFSLEEDMSRQIYISSYRAILSLEGHINNEGAFLINAEDSITEVLLNGTIEGSNVSLMEGYCLADWNSRVSEMAEKRNLIVDYSIVDVNVGQDDPWNVRIDMVINISIRDKSNLAYWNRTQVISSKIEVTNFEDPLYLINTNGKITNKINNTIYYPFVSGTNVSNLIQHLSGSHYIVSASGPSFLDRLEGKTLPNENGIESLVNLTKLSSQGIFIKDKSAVDYIYFSADNPVSYSIQGMPGWFKIDEEHLDVYGVSELIS